MKTLLTFLALILALTTKSAVIILPLEGFPNTNVLDGSDLFLVRHTNSPVGTWTNKNILYRDLLTLLSNAIPTSSTNFYTTNTIINTNMSGGSESLWTNQNGIVSLILGDTNSLKVMTNGLQGIFLGDTNTAAAYFGWPANGLTYLSVLPGTNRWVHAALDRSTTNGSYATIQSESGVNPIFSEALVVLTNGTIASELDLVLRKTGSYLLLGGNVNESFVGIQNGASLSVPMGGNMIRAFWGGTDRFFLSTNGNVSFFGSATNYGNLYARSNLVVLGTALFNDPVVMSDGALILQGLVAQGITNTLGFQSLGRISLGNSPSDLTTSSNLFRQYGPMHIHDLLYLQHVAIDPGNLLYVTAGRNLATVAGVNSTTAGYLAGVTSLIQPQLDSKQPASAALTNLSGNPHVVTQIFGVGITVASNGGIVTLTGSGGGGSGGSTMWTNQANVVHLIAGSTNFAGGGLLNSIVSNNTYSTIAGGYNNSITNNSSYSAIGGGTTNTIRTNSPFSTIGGGNQNHVDESAQYSTIAGGNGNSVSFDAYASTVGGGTGNRSAFLHGTVAGGSGNLAGATNAFVGGGSANSAIGANSVIAGGGDNSITGGSTYPYQTIGGGAANTMIQAAYGTIGGGAGNIINAGAESSVIAGGSSNVVQSGVGVNTSPNNFIGGGYSNTVVYPSAYSIVVGGLQNTILSGADRSFIGGGYLNSLQADNAVVAGGRQNLVETNSTNSSILGGYLNKIWTNSSFSAIGGGEANSVGDGANNATLPAHHSFVGGGLGNNAVSPYSFIGGGQLNVIRGDSTALGWQVIGGGRGNDIGADDGAVNQTFSASFSTIGGGDANNIQYGAEGATISGGMANTIRIQNTNAAIAGGRGNIIHTGPYSAILGGQNNQIGDLGAGFGADHSVIVGSGIKNTNNFAIELGYTNNAKVRIDQTNLHLIGDMKIKMTNGAFGGYVLTSDDFGNLTLQSSGGGSGGGGGGGPIVNPSATAFGWYNVRATPFSATGDGIADDTAALELAIATAKTNSPGVVMLPAGTYLIKRPLYLPSNVSLRGAGYSSRITKPASVRVSLTNATYAAGGFSVTLSSTNGFEVGGSIYLADTTSYEWLSTQATITNITGFVVTFNRPIDGALQTNRGSFASTSFPLVRNEADLTTNIVVRDLVLDHNKSANDPTNEFTLGTIHYEGNFGGVVDGVWLLNAASDAYSDQATNGLSGFTPATNYIRRTANTIRNSQINSAGRHGVHLGTCMDGAFVLNNDIKSCAGFAHFYCAFVTYTISSGNIIDSCGSGFAGIDHRDYNNIISGNIIKNSGATAIDLSSSGSDGTGGRCTITGNAMYGGVGRGIFCAQPDCAISGNTIAGSNTLVGIELSANADRTTISGNTLVSLSGSSGSIGIKMVDADDCRLVANNIRGFQSLVNVQGSSRLVADANALTASTSTYWNFNGAASTNIWIRGNATTTANPITQSTAIVRLVDNGMGDNSGNDPASAGDWSVGTNKTFLGTFVTWTNTTSTNLSVFAFPWGAGGWRKLAFAP